MLCAAISSAIPLPHLRGCPKLGFLILPDTPSAIVLSSNISSAQAGPSSKPPSSPHRRLLQSPVFSSRKREGHRGNRVRAVFSRPRLSPPRMLKGQSLSLRQKLFPCLLLSRCASRGRGRTPY